MQDLEEFIGSSKKGRCYSVWGRLCAATVYRNLYVNVDFEGIRTNASIPFSMEIRNRYGAGKTAKKCAGQSVFAAKRHSGT